MEIGATLPHAEVGSDAGAIRAYLEGIEALGVRHLLAYDHVVGVDRSRRPDFDGPYDHDVAFHEPLTFLSFAAGVTTSVELVSAVVILPQRQTVLLAKQVAEIAVVSGNRIRLGVGIGWNRAEYDALGVPFKDRGRRLGEQVDLMRQLWTQESIDFRGEFHVVDGVGIKPRPSVPVPVWFGGDSPAALDRCAAVGDGWMPLTGPARAAEAIERIRRHRASLGLSMEAFGVQAQIRFAGGSPERWRKHADTWRDLGATHLAIVTHDAEPTSIEGHLARIRRVRDAVYWD